MNTGVSLIDPDTGDEVSVSVFVSRVLGSRIALATRRETGTWESVSLGIMSVKRLVDLLNEASRAAENDPWSGD
jgi:hypothetical protein